MVVETCRAATRLSSCEATEAEARIDDSSSQRLVEKEEAV